MASFVGLKDVVQVEQEMKSAAKVTPSWAHMDTSGGDLCQGGKNSHNFRRQRMAIQIVMVLVPMQRLKVYMPGLCI
jgi:hypothetical protein